MTNETHIAGRAAVAGLVQCIGAGLAAGLFASLALGALVLALHGGS